MATDTEMKYKSKKRLTPKLRPIRLNDRVRRNIMNCFRILACITVIAHSWVTAANEKDKVLRMELKQRNKPRKYPIPANHPLTQVNVFVKLHRVQPEASKGLRFAVDIANNGNGAVELMDPTQLVNISLRNDEGWGCIEYSGVALVNTGNPAASKIRFTGTRPYVVEKEQIGGAPPSTKTVHDITDGTIRLEAGEQLHFVLRIEEIIANASEYNFKRRRYTREHNPRSPDFKEAPLRMSRPEPTMIPIPPGTYKLGGMVLLVPKPQRFHKMLQWDAVTVHLGPQSNDSK